MNLDDLRSELNTRADDIDAQAAGRMAGVRAKVAQRRRRRAGAAVAATAVVVSAIVGIPIVGHLSSGPEPVVTPDGPFPEKIDGDTRIAYAMTEEGQKKLVVTFTPDDSDFLLDVHCDALAERPNITGLKGVINGTKVFSMCIGPYGGSQLVGTSATRTQVRERWSRIGVRAGEPVTITMTVEMFNRGKAPNRPTIPAYGIGVYDMTGDRVETSGIQIPIQKTFNGRTYELAEDGYDIAQKRDPKAELDVPRLDDPALVTYQNTGSSKSTLHKVFIDGKRTLFDSIGGSGRTELLTDTDPHELVARKLLPQSPTKTVVAYYTLAD